MNSATISHHDTVCPSAKRIKQYAGGKLKPSIAQNIEHHIVSCQSCIGTLQNVFNNEATDSASLSTEELLHPKVEKKSSLNLRPALFILSIFIVVSGVAYGVYSLWPVVLSQFEFESNHDVTQQAQTLAQSQIIAPPIENLPVKKEKIIAPVIEEKETEQKPEEKPEAKSEIIPDIKQGTKIPDVAKENKEPEKNVRTDKNKAQEQVKETPVEAVIIEPPSPEIIYIDGYKVWFVPKKNEEKNIGYKKQLKFIFNSINSGQYQEALIECESYLSTYPSDETLIYYKGYINYMMQANEQAIRLLNRPKRSVFYEDARWYKSLSLNRMSRVEEARHIWKDIIKSNNTYAPKAKQLMDLIEGN